MAASRAPKPGPILLGGRRSAQPHGPRWRPVVPTRGTGDGRRAAAPPNSFSISINAAMRFSVAGWVEKRLSIRAPESGLTMKRWAVAGLRSAASFGMRCAMFDILAKADASAARPAADLRAGTVGSIFAGTADRHLHEHSGERRDDCGDENADNTEAVVVVAAASAEEEGEIGEHRNSAGDCRGDGHGERVAVLNMGELVGHHPGDLVAGERLEEAGGGADGGMLGVATGSKGVWLRIVGDIDTRHGQAGPGGQVANDVIELGRASLVHLAGAGHGKHHLVGVPVGKEVQAGGDDEGDNMRRCSRRSESRRP